MAATTTITDGDLLERATNGDDDALTALIDRHLHPAWRVASVAAADPALAEAAVVEGFCDGLRSVRRQPDPSQPLRARIVASTRRAAALNDAGAGTQRPTADDPVIDAFWSLPEKSRTALWLTEVEGGTAEQVAPVLGLDRAAADNLAERAAVALRERLAADLAADATATNCRKALTRLPAHAAGTLPPAEHDRVGEHLAACTGCAAWLAAVVTPRPALRAVITPPPAELPPAIAARWTEQLEAHRRRWLAPFTGRAMGTAAAAVLAIGLGGGLLFGDRDDDRGPELASPAAVEAAEAADTGRAALGQVGTSPMPASSYRPAATTGGRLAPTSRTGTPSRVTLPRSLSQTPSATTGTPPSGGSSTTPPPANQNASGPVAPAPEAPPDLPPIPPPTLPPLPAPPPPPQVDIGLGGVGSVGAGGCTGGTVFEVNLGGCTPPPSEQTITVEVPGHPPIGL